MKILIAVLFGWCLLLTAWCNLNYYFIKENTDKLEKIVIISNDTISNCKLIIIENEN